MTTTYSPADALIYVTETLGITLDWLHDHFVHNFPTTSSEGELYLHDPLNDAMAALYSIHSEAINMAIHLGIYHRNSTGQLTKPTYYTNNQPTHTVGQVQQTPIAHPNTHQTPCIIPPRRAGLVDSVGGAINE